MMIELPAADRWMYSTNGKDYGPVSWSVIESMVQDDRLSQDDLVVREGETTYARIADIFRQQSRVAGGLNKATDESNIDYLIVRPVGLGEDIKPVNKWAIQKTKHVDKLHFDMAKLDCARYMVEEAIHPTRHRDAVVIGAVLDDA